MKISNFKPWPRAKSEGFQISNFQSGFTLVEILVVVAIFVVVEGIITAILFSSLRGTNKTNTMTDVRQNGNYALSQITKMVRYASELNSVDSCTLSPDPLTHQSSITFTSFDGGETTFECCAAGALDATIASNSGSLTCSSANRISLLDTIAVSLNSCYFTCSRDSISNYPIIGIYFSVSPNASSNFVENVETINFESSVSIRNPSR